ncbi:MAG: hypothetical protein DCC75_07845 [Proteobacteria bacterium]|nr:MAG: hypothetical protein DCC75_07845 [Pseudomonadota bacterium]
MIGLWLVCVVQAQPTALNPPRDTLPLLVRAAFHLHDINAVDEQEETFEFSGVLTLIWQDKRQAFDPVQAGVNEKVYSGSFQFNEISPAWYPQVVLVNESELLDKQGTLLRVLPDGTNILTETIDASAKTDFNMRKHPFDSQRLKGVFELFGFDKDVVKLEPLGAESVTHAPGLGISQWHFNGISAEFGSKVAPYLGSEKAASTFTVNIDISRESLFMLRLVLFPLAIMVALSWSVFWMERSSLGDRINVSFIGILTAVAYQMVISELLPHMSYITFMNAYLNISMLVMCAAVVVNLAVGACDKRGKTELGDIIDFRCRWIFPLTYFGLLLLAYAIVQFL